jgi:hypothetical protein
VAFDGRRRNIREIEGHGTGAEELFDFEHDVLERWNLIGSVRPTLAAAIRAAMTTIKEPASKPQLARH